MAMTGRVHVLLLSALFVGAADCSQPRTAELALSLSSLISGCRVESRWLGIVQERPDGAFLVCKAEEFLLLKPSNLLGHVRISSEAAALEFVRFFSGPETYGLFDLNGAVEVGRAVSPRQVDHKFNEVAAEVFDREFGSPIVEKHNQRGEQVFIIQRYLVYPGNKVQLVRETVISNGYHSLIVLKVVSEDASGLGLMHFGRM